MLTTQRLGLDSGAIVFNGEQFTTNVDGTEPRHAPLAQPTEQSTTRDDGTVPVKQLLRWQDDGGAIPPGVDLHPG